MKTSLLVLAFASTLTLTVLATPPEKSAAATEAQKKIVPTDKPVPKSSFGVPAKPQDGHDPFFPTSDRLFAIKTPKPATSGLANVGIVFNGISGSQDKRFAMINGRTFAEGEEAPVNTSSGRQRVLLIAIKGDTAVIEIGGERRELIFQGR